MTNKNTVTSLTTVKKLTIGLLAVMMAGLFALPATALAHEGGEATVEGQGRLYAKGTGEVDIDMDGHIRLRVDGNVTIVDNAGDMRVRLRGASDTNDQERSTNVSLTDFRGSIKVSGTDFSVTVDGQVLLNAQGRGEVYLVGDGVYKTRRGEIIVGDGDAIAWDGLVHLGDVEVQPAN
jgi:hypothetical protein